MRLTQRLYDGRVVSPLDPTQTMSLTHQRRRSRTSVATIGEFAIETRLNGQAGVSSLYLADADDEVRVAVQLLRFLADRPATHQRLLKAVEVRERLDCDGLMPVIASGHGPQGSWVALELLDDAPTLRQVLDANGPLSLPRALAILGPVANALDAGHAHRLVCDSLTADAILVRGEPGGDERGVLIDLGPAWSGEVRPGRLLGDPSGLAPEEIRGAPPSAAANVYALAALLFRCLTGEPPFRAPTRAGVLSSHLSAAPPRISERLPGASPALDAVIASALAKDPRDRPRSAGELIDRARRAAGVSAAPERLPADGLEHPAAPPPPEPSAALTEEEEGGAIAPTAASPGWAPSPRAIRVIRRVAVGVPAVALTVLAVIAALHSDPVKRIPAAQDSAPATGRQSPQTPATVKPLTPVQDLGVSPPPSGHIDVTTAGGGDQLTVVAAHLPPEGSHPRQAYAVWLFNSRRDAALLGFVVPSVGPSGGFESHRALPPHAGRYRQIAVTLESAAQSRPQGPLVLRGELPASALTESR
jgi:serine/threonine protein kinase